MKIYICDFDDSFTYNLYSELLFLYDKNKIEVIGKNRILSFLQNLEYSIEEKSVVILGPGPGHPDDYSYLFQSIRKLIQNPKIFTMGICLGHQLIWRVLGAEVSHCQRPIHGQTVCYELSESLSNSIGLARNIKVQRYNSLCVKVTKELTSKIQKENWSYLSFENELIISNKENLLTYQFHPESIGTTCPKSFFTPIIKFLI